MEFKQLQSFVAVVKYGSFTKAAEKLYTSQPTISTHIRMLEEELNSSLIIRTTKSIEITPRGWEAYESAVRILEQRDRLLHRWNGAEQKIITLGASTIPSTYILPEILPEYGRAYPKIYFVIHQSDSQGIIEELLSGNLDIGLIGMNCKDESLICVPFYRDRMVMITPVTEHFLSLKEEPEVPIMELLKEPIILRENGSGSQKSADRFFESIGVTEDELHITARINDQESIKNLVAGGLGISVISKKAAQNFIAEKRILMFELPEQTARRNLYLVFRKNAVLPNYVKEFADYLKRHYERLLPPGWKLDP